MAEPGPIARVAEDEIVLEWRTVGRFTIRPQRSVRVEPACGAPPAVVREFARGPIAAVRLRQQGYLVLHGSAVSIGDKAVVFCGASGWGKSTLAAKLHQRGHHLLADDFSAIRLSRHGHTLRATSTALKLWSDSAAAIGLDAAALPRLHGLVDKRRLRARVPPSRRTVPLGRVMILARDAPVALTHLGKQDAFVELLRHSYGARTFAALDGAAHFARCAALVRTVPVVRLGTGASLEYLDAVADLIEATCR